MAFYKIVFTPSGPYFFGNESTFKYKPKNKEDNPYYIIGEDIPSQSTVFGALRYVLLPEKGFDNLNKEINVKAIGTNGFSLDSDSVQSFGIIKRMSAVFISADDELFIPTPFDHNRSVPERIMQGEREIELYTPFVDYREMCTLEGKKLYPTEYSAKNGVCSSFMSVKDNHLESDLISGELRAGNNRSHTEEGFFKKEYKRLKAGYAFCVFAELDGEGEELTKDIHIVFMGQGKVPFSVKFQPFEGTIDDKYNEIKNAVRKKPVGIKRLYCVSDVLVESDLYARMSFAIVKTRDNRSFKRSAGRYTKSTVLHKLVKAGSVFFPKEAAQCDFALASDKQKNAFTVGYNQIINLQD